MLHQRNKEGQLPFPKIIPGFWAGRGPSLFRPALQSSLLHRPLRPDSSQPLQQELGVQASPHPKASCPTTRSVCPVLWDNSRGLTGQGLAHRLQEGIELLFPAVCGPSGGHTLCHHFQQWMGMSHSLWILPLSQRGRKTWQ